MSKLWAFDNFSKRMLFGHFCNDSNKRHSNIGNISKQRYYGIDFLGAKLRHYMQFGNLLKQNNIKIKILLAIWKRPGHFGNISKQIHFGKISNI